MQKIMFNDRYGLTQAVIDGRKTMTRRVSGLPAYPRYKVGEVVAVAQNYEQVYHQEGLETMEILVSGMKTSSGWKNKMFVKAEMMPHRIRITGIRCERLQEISDEDCMREGIEYLGDGRYTFKNMSRAGYNNNLILHSPREAFAALIDKVSGRGTWERNPWVVVYEFELIK